MNSVLTRAQLIPMILLLLTLIAEEMKIGDVYGPMKVPHGYALIKLNDIRKVDKPKIT